MARSTLLFGLIFVIFLGNIEATKYNFYFENDLEGWASKRDAWIWSSGQGDGAPNLPSASGTGFAIMDKTFDSDELYTPSFSIPQGGKFSMSYFVKSQYIGSVNLNVDLYENDDSVSRLVDVRSSPTATQFQTITVDIPPSQESVSLTIFCYNGAQAPAGDFMNGCAVDQITVEVYGDDPTTTPAPPQTTTAAPTNPPTTAAPTDPPTTAAPTNPPTTAAPTNPPTTAAPTNPPTTAAPTNPPTTAAPTNPPTTAAPTNPPNTTAAPTNPPTTAAPTNPPNTTAAPTNPPTTAAPTNPPNTTAAPTNPPTTAAPTNPPNTTAAPTNPPTTAAPTNPPTTAAPTNPPTTAAPTNPPTTAAPTDPPTTAAPTNPPTTAAPTNPPNTTAAPTNPPTTVAPTNPPTTAAPTNPPTTAAPTNPPSTAAPTDPATTAAPTNPSTTEAPQGPLTFNFEDSTQGWSLANMNGASWERTSFNSAGLPVGNPPNGPWVLQVFSNEIFTSTVLAQSPQLEALATEMNVAITFWMDGSREFPSQLKVRRRQSFDSFDVSPIINLDPYGDQENTQWNTFSGTLAGLRIGESFSIILEGSLGADINNSVAVDQIVLEGVKTIQSNPSEFFDFESGLLGWTQTNMDGGHWVLQNYSQVESSVAIPAPEGNFFLLANRFDIHSGVIALESPSFGVSPGQRKKVHIKFWSRGSVVYPASLRLRKKSLGGSYDALPFLDLTSYGDIDNSGWISLDREYTIPLDETESAFQLVIEADLGSGRDNMVAVDTLRIVTETIY